MRRYLAAILAVGMATSAGSAAAQPDLTIEVDAVAGEPFGVARIVVRREPGGKPEPSQSVSRSLRDDGRRVLYPAFRDYSSRRRSGAVLRAAEARFLFTGQSEFDVTFDAESTRTVRVRPRLDPESHRLLLADWADLYSKSASARSKSGFCPPQLDRYLAAMLSRRLNGVSIPVDDGARLQTGDVELDVLLGTLSGAESVRLAMQKRVLLEGGDSREKADQPLPRPVSVRSVFIPAAPADVEIEPIARHVPAEFFYVRCGSYTNFRWLRSRFDLHGGRLRDLGSSRSLDYEIASRLERQLAVKETALARLFGDAAIADVALIGADTFVREGAAIGILFHAKSNAALSASLLAQRSARRLEEPQATETETQIAGRTVSFVATPDHRVRSFYAVDGDFHLVTTSREIVRRFFEAGSGKDALADLPEFRYARSLLPLSRGDTAFVYLSDPWFRLLVSPHYRIEMTRRMQAEAEMELVEFARLAAEAESRASDSIKALIDGGFLPREFGPRPDGSRAEIVDGKVVDSLRGARRSLSPILDVDVSAATLDEVAAYGKFAEQYGRIWQRIDPAIVGLRREPAATPEREKIVLDVHITPYARSHYEWARSCLGPARKTALVPPTGRLLFLQAHLNYSVLSLLGGTADGKSDVTTFLIAIDAPIQMAKPMSEIGDGLLHVGTFLTPKTPIANDENPEDPSKSAVRWLGPFGWPESTLIDVNAYKARAEGEMKLVPAERPAQLRLDLADLAASQAAPGIAAEIYNRALKTSRGNTEFLQLVQQQFRLDANQALTSAERLLAARPTCPLGGEYQFDSTSAAHQGWFTTAQPESLQTDFVSPPAEYRAPLLDWFHGLHLDFSIDDTTLTTHLELELQVE